MILLFEDYFPLVPQNAILLFFIINLLLFSGILINRGWKLKLLPDKLLGLFMFLSALYINPWMLGHTGWYSMDGFREFLLFIPFHQYFLFGPITYFLTISLTDPKWKFDKNSALHLLPAALYLLYSLIVAIVDLVILDEYYFYSDGMDKDYKKWYQLTGLLAMLIYGILSIKKYNQYRLRIFENLSFADEVKISWLKRFLLALTVIIIFRAVFSLISVENGDWAFRWWYYLLFGAISLYLAFSGYSSSLLLGKLAWSKNRETAGDIISTKTSVNVSDKLSGNRVRNDLETNFDQALLDKIEREIEEKELFRNHMLTLTDLTNRVGANTALVSKAINDGKKMNFNDFINSYRIEEVKKEMIKGRLKKETLEGLSYEAGFNSKSTFLRAFKKNTGRTPTEYLLTEKQK